jgi:hypothetical protein
MEGDFKRITFLLSLSPAVVVCKMQAERTLVSNVIICVKYPKIPSRAD